MRGLIKIVSIGILLTAGVWAQRPYRVGTTAADFLEIGVGSAASAMGEAYVAVANDVSATYWNPAGVAEIKGNQAQFMYQPWLVDINNLYGALAFQVPQVGSFALSFTQVGYGEMDVTTLSQQAGTGEKFSANEFAFGVTYARKLAQWFSFGASGKYVHSQIWHMSAGAMAVDMGVLVATDFLSVTHNRKDGLKIGMSISNYGTRMQYNGIDLLNPIDILPGEQGNYGDVAGQFRLGQWELPQIFRIGVSVQPIISRFADLTLAADVLHPNDNSESMNLGGELELRLPGTGSLFLRSGYKALFMDASHYGLTMGAGLKLNLMGNQKVTIDYAYKYMDLLGIVHAYTVGMTF